jgi:hypothetical protein
VAYLLDRERPAEDEMIMENQILVISAFAILLSASFGFMAVKYREEKNEREFYNSRQETQDWLELWREAAGRGNSITPDLHGDGYSKNDHCQWCGSMTEKDNRGNCSACGGPK